MYWYVKSFLRFLRRLWFGWLWLIDRLLWLLGTVLVHIVIIAVLMVVIVVVVSSSELIKS